MPETENQNNQFKNPADEQETVSFAVMPHDPQDVQGGGDVSMADIDAGSEPHEGIWHSKTTYIVIGLLILIILGAAAYFLLWSTPNEAPQQQASRLPKVWVSQYFGAEVCADQAKCGEAADPDKDGLGNYDEFVEQTDPTSADTDKDGLADGDEINIYLTDPTAQFTDKRPVSQESGYTDGSQVKNEYDPLTPGLKMTDARKQQIQTAIQEYGLHEPTTTTLQTAAAPQPKTVTVFIVNGKFDPATLSVNVNDTVVWLNKDATNHQIMSNPHPTHSALSDLSSGILGTNQTFSYKFTQTGTYQYHDETLPTSVGTVEVK